MRTGTGALSRTTARTPAASRSSSVPGCSALTSVCSGRRGENSGASSTWLGSACCGAGGIAQRAAGTGAGAEGSGVEHAEDARRTRFVQGLELRPAAPCTLAAAGCSAPHTVISKQPVAATTSSPAPVATPWRAQDATGRMQKKSLHCKHACKHFQRESPAAHVILPVVPCQLLGTARCAVARR